MNYLYVGMLISMWNTCEAMEQQIFQERLLIKENFNTTRKNRLLLKKALTTVLEMPAGSDKDIKVAALRDSFKGFHATALDNSRRCSAYHVKYARRYKDEARLIFIMAGNL